MPRRLLCLGGSGFVSGTLARRAVAAGWQVWAVTRGRRPMPSGVTAATADRKDGPALAAALASAGVDRFDLAVDCIGYEPQDARQDVALLRGRAAHLVFISTDFVFDPAHRRFPQGEESDHWAADGYGGKKRLCELELIGADTGDMAWSVVRPCHIYGPGSLLGCLPEHGRDAKLIERLRSGEALRLVGGGHFLQQPILAADLADLILGLAGRSDLHRRLFQAAGPDVVESRTYYRFVADRLGVELRVEEVPVAGHLAAHPAAAPFLCHRIYDLAALRAAGLPVPATSLATGLALHVAALEAG